MMVVENTFMIKKQGTLRAERRISKRRSNFTVDNLDQKSETDISIARSHFGEDPTIISDFNHMKITTSRMTKEQVSFNKIDQIGTDSPCEKYERMPYK